MVFLRLCYPFLSPSYVYEAVYCEFSVVQIYALHILAKVVCIFGYFQKTIFSLFQIYQNKMQNQSMATQIKHCHKNKRVLKRTLNYNFSQNTLLYGESKEIVTKLDSVRF